MGSICVGNVVGVGEGPEGGGFDGTRGGLGESERKVSETEGGGEVIRFATISGTNRYWRTGSGDGKRFLSM